MMNQGSLALEKLKIKPLCDADIPQKNTLVRDIFSQDLIYYWSSINRALI